MAFEEVRPYTPGDEVRFIDWNVTARAGDPHVKVFQEERELRLLVLLDDSASQSFAGDAEAKIRTGAHAAVALAAAATRGGDRAGLVTFDDKVRTGFLCGVALVICFAWPVPRCLAGGKAGEPIWSHQSKKPRAPWPAAGLWRFVPISNAMAGWKHCVDWGGDVRCCCFPSWIPPKWLPLQLGWSGSKIPRAEPLS